MAVVAKPRPARLPARFDLTELRDLVAEWRTACGANVERRRENLGLHRRELADLCGVTEPTVIRVENGQLNPRDELRLAIAGALRCEVDDLWRYPANQRVSDRAQAVA